MQRERSTTMRTLFLIMLALLGLLLTACDTEGDDLADLRADTFTGGTPTNVSGPDADNDAARAEAEAMLAGRNFELTPGGFSLSSGPVNSEPVDGSDYGVAGGDLSLDGDDATVELDVFSNNPDVTDANLRGSFSVDEAGSAIVNPGRTFTMNWEVDFDYLGIPVSFNMDQELTGTDFSDALD
jgi:hypothetical protein